MYKTGDLVIAMGLKSVAGLSGARGLILSFDSDKRRYPVEFEACEHMGIEGGKKLFKCSNLASYEKPIVKTCLTESLDD